jgi:hypothetical protein
MVNAYGAIAGDPAAPCGAKTAANQFVLAREQNARYGKTSVSLVSEVSGFLSPEWNPFLYNFHFSKLMCFFQSSFRCTRA